jgi:mono/diheme cytochrome c family protein
MAKRQIISGLVVLAFGLSLGAATAIAGAEEGKQLFDAKKCINCHTLGDQKGPMAKLGGPLDGTGSKRDLAWQKAYLTDPKSKVPDGKMPKQKLTDQEISDLAEYMMTLK